MSDEKTAAFKMGIGGGALALYGLTLEQWVAVVTILYFVLQIGLLLPKYWRLVTNWMRGTR